MPPPLHADSPIRATIAQLWTAAITLVAVTAPCVWWVNDTYREMRAESAELRAEVVAMRQQLDSKFVTWTDARILALELKEANRPLNIVMPEIKPHS
jgi:hypothetical protein